MTQPDGSTRATRVMKPTTSPTTEEEPITMSPITSRRRHVRSRWALLAPLASLLLAAGACSGGSDGGDASAASAVEVAGASGPIAVALADFAISPEMIDAPAGTPLTFAVRNDGPAPHTFGVTANGETFETATLQAGQSATLEVPALEAGDYETWCTVPGHKDAGMIGMLMVAEDGSSTASTGEGSPSTASTGHAGMTVQEMLDGHRESVEAFPAETAGVGNRPLRPELDHGVKVFELTATEVEWEIAPGVTKTAMAYNGQIPGPELRAHEGDRVRLVFQNQLSQPSSVHFHGLTVPFRMDGVPYITQDPTLPGEYYEYEFTVKDPPGTYVYHSHFNSTEQVGKGLYGAFIVEPPGRPPWDVEYTLFTGDGPLDYGLNAKSFPATTPIVASKGDTVLIRMANDGAMIHPMHLHGYHFKVISEDGFPLDHPYWADTLMVAPGQRFDVLVEAKYPGVWAFHCHILPHVEGPQGMFGMVTALVVE